jgi:phospholipase C
LFASLTLSACGPTQTPPDVAQDAGDATTPPTDGGEMDATTSLPDAVVADRQALRPPPIERTQPESVRAMERRGCMFRAGAWAAETLGSEVPIGAQIPIDHVLVLMQENRSFDHYFSKLPEAGQPDVDVAPEAWSNPDRDGTPVARYHDSEFCIEDVNHGWSGTHAQYNNGAMDGFVTTNNPNGRRAMGYLDQSDLPFYYSLATTFAIGDRYFSSVLGPTWPNRMYLMSATSFGNAANDFVESDTSRTPANHLFRRLDEAQIEWRDYAGGFRMLSFYPFYGITRAATRRSLRTLDQLMADLRTGDLPPVAFIEPSYTGNGGNRHDEHPPGTPQMGSQFVEGVVRALMASPAWRRTALFILYDEHGGFADHAAPPEACAPDELPPVNAAGTAVPGAFDRLGIRVPFIVVSPFAKRRFVSHTVYDHASVARFIEARFGLPAMTARDANATPPMDVFDFANPPFVTPPTLAPTIVDEAMRARCRAAFPNEGGL